MTDDEGRPLGTAPPTEEEPAGWRRLRTSAVKRASALVMPLVQRVARDYIGGETLDDAMCVAHRLAGENLPHTLGFWDTEAYDGPQVAKIYLDSVERLAASGLDGYLSIKPPALRFDAALATELAAVAETQKIRLHCDSHGTEVADPSYAMMETMHGRLSASRLSTTLPGRWSRSLADADWAIERGMIVRVVKGQWPDPADPARDMAAGCLEVIDRLAGRARHVAMASHDLPLVEEAIGRLRAAGTSCELELIHGVPMAEPLRWAREHGVGVRIYVPFGKGFVPNAIGLLRRNPRLAWRIVKGLVAAGGRTGTTANAGPAGC